MTRSGRQSTPRERLEDSQSYSGTQSGLAHRTGKRKGEAAVESQQEALPSTAKKHKPTKTTNWNWSIHG